MYYNEENEENDKNITLRIKSRTKKKKQNARKKRREAKRRRRERCLAYFRSLQENNLSIRAGMDVPNNVHIAVYACVEQNTTEPPPRSCFGIRSYIFIRCMKRKIVFGKNRLAIFMRTCSRRPWWQGCFQDDIYKKAHFYSSHT